MDLFYFVNIAKIRFYGCCHKCFFSKVGQFPAVQAKVYEEFAKNIPGFKPLTDAEAASIFPKPDVPGKQLFKNYPTIFVCVSLFSVKVIISILIII